jgi:DNA-binding SARP family transcriptional activator/Tfp pilus assembly protein PilF
MRFRVMGPLEVWSAEGGWTAIGAPKWRALLGCLLVRHGQLVSTESLILELWGDNPPAKANNLVSIYVHRLRRAIGDIEGRVLVYRAPGYLLRLGPADVDLQEFESLVTDGRSALAAGDPERASTQLTAALELWRGPLLADLTPPSTLISTEAERTHELRLAAAELRAEADLACGRSAELVPELRRLVADNPIREGLWLLLIRALDGAGRHAEALETYTQARQVISDELGVDPGAELQQLYAQLLAADASSASAARRTRPPPRAQPRPRPRGASPAPGVAAAPGPAAGPVDTGAAGADAAPADAEAELAVDTIPLGDAPGTIAIGTFGDVGEAAEGPAGPPLSRPAQLPADIGDFTGRETHVRHLCDMLLQSAAGSSPGALRIAVVAGAAGLGKTTLAVHAAHEISAQFSDGQLYVDLNGASAQSARPGEVLARFLRDLGVEGDKVPVSDEERAALYRTRLTGRRMLVLLDNAKDTAQIRPLLPGSASCAVLVTTRNRTPDLASTRFVDLNVLDDSEALEMFSRIVDDDRPAAEPDATAEVLLACAGLPLAIRICAARLAARRQWRVATLANRLRDEHRRLDELTTGDLAVRASFQVSYDSLRKVGHGADPAHAFRLLGLWQGGSLSLPAAAALLGEPAGDIEVALETLVDANLLESRAADWYSFHDLLRFYATERAQDEEPETARKEALERLLRWYLHMADRAALVVSPHRYRIAPDEPLEWLPATPASVEDALDWYDSERANVVAATRQAASLGMHDIAWRLPTALYPIFNRRQNWADCITVHRIAVDSARLAGHRMGEAWALNNLGQALVRIRDIEGLGPLEQALAIRQELDDRTGEAQTALSLADAYLKLKGQEEALERYERCLEVLHKAGNASLLGTGYNNLGEVYLDLGRLPEAADCFRQARDILSVSGYGLGYVLHNLGRVSLASGVPDDAIAILGDAHRIHRESGDLIGQATALRYLGQAHRDTGDVDGAREAWSAALEMFSEIGEETERAEVIAALATLPTPPRALDATCPFLPLCSPTALMPDLGRRSSVSSISRGFMPGSRTGAECGVLRLSGQARERTGNGKRHS